MRNVSLCYMPVLERLEFGLHQPQLFLAQSDVCFRILQAVLRSEVTILRVFTFKNVTQVENFCDIMDRMRIGPSASGLTNGTTTTSGKMNGTTGSSAGAPSSVSSSIRPVSPPPHLPDRNQFRSDPVIINAPTVLSSGGGTTASSLLSELNPRRAPPDLDGGKFSRSGGAVPYKPRSNAALAPSVSPCSDCTSSDPVPAAQIRHQLPVLLAGRKNGLFAPPPAQPFNYNHFQQLLDFSSVDVGDIPEAVWTAFAKTPAAKAWMADFMWSGSKHVFYSMAAATRNSFGRVSPVGRGEECQRAMEERAATSSVPAVLGPTFVRTT